jgi:ligand-binding sensor domain-containing protein
LNNLAGSGGLPTNDVYAVAEDLEGQIWVGTNRGVAVFYVPDAIFGSGNYDAQQILIEQDGNVQILLETEAVSSIAIDGANRKWIGTETSGVYLISADGRSQLQHFTVENSPLPSNTISSIAIEGNSGEVFIGTDRGIISYRSDATTGEAENVCALVYPNPVHENYTGPIAITGLVRDSEVKITDVAGNLVYRTTSLGGQAIWPGTDLAGNRVSTGVYLVLVADRSGSTKCNTKVLVVR